MLIETLKQSLATMAGRLAIAAAFACVLVAQSHAETPAVDPHRLFEERCTRCHGHAGEFARAQLQLVGTSVAGTKVRSDLSTFLRRHQGGVTAPEAAALIDAFRRQIQGGGLFQERCGICHKRAYELARLHLILDEGKLMGRYSGRDMAEFLPIHGARTTEEAEQLFDMLLWHRQTIEAAAYGG